MKQVHSGMYEKMNAVTCAVQIKYPCLSSRGTGQMNSAMTPTACAIATYTKPELSLVRSASGVP